MSPLSYIYNRNSYNWKDGLAMSLKCCSEHRIYIMIIYVKHMDYISIYIFILNTFMKIKTTALYRRIFPASTYVKSCLSNGIFTGNQAVYLIHSLWIHLSTTHIKTDLNCIRAYVQRCRYRQICIILLYPGWFCCLKECCRWGKMQSVHCPAESSWRPNAAIDHGLLCLKRWIITSQ